jgi:3-oxoacyl-[acyl-carrier protein] reductase
VILSGKNAIVTGASRGIGRAIVEAFAESGASIWAHARKDTREFRADMEAVAKSNGVVIEPVFFDVTDAPVTDGLAERTHQISVVIDRNDEGTF